VGINTFTAQELGQAELPCEAGRSPPAWLLYEQLPLDGYVAPCGEPLCPVLRERLFGKLLEQAIQLVSSDPQVQADLRQFAMLFLLQNRVRCFGKPGCTGENCSWCLEHCCSVLHAHLNKGHDLFSHHRGEWFLQLHDECDDPSFQAEEAELDNSLPKLLEIRSMLGELRQHLGPFDQRVLDLKAEELQEDEIAVELGISQQTVSRHWHEIVNRAKAFRKGPPA